MKHASLVLGSIALVGLLSSAAHADPKVDKGMKLFTDQKCTLCHSIADKGNKKGPLDGAGSKLSPAEIKAWLVDPKGMTEKTKAARKPAMKSFATLPAEDVDALVAYVATLKKK
jgi:mono/diheme cytochrome c family protein